MSHGIASQPRTVRLLQRSNADVLSLLVSQIRRASLPAPIQQYPYAKGQDDSTFELAWPSLRIAASFTEHRVPGWRIVRLTRRDIETGASLERIKATLQARTIWDEMKYLRDERT